MSKMAHQAVSCSTVCLLSSRCATRGCIIRHRLALPTCIWTTNCHVTYPSQVVPACFDASQLDPAVPHLRNVSLVRLPGDDEDASLLWDAGAPWCSVHSKTSPVLSGGKGHHLGNPIGVKVSIDELINQVTPSDSCEKIVVKICLQSLLKGVNQ